MFCFTFTSDFPKKIFFNLQPYFVVGFSASVAATGFSHFMLLVFFGAPWGAWGGDLCDLWLARHERARCQICFFPAVFQNFKFLGLKLLSYMCVMFVILDITYLFTCGEWSLFLVREVCSI